MGKTKGTSAERPNLITKFMDLKRKSTGKRVSSPTGETSSPPTKNVKPTSPNTELNHTPTPREMTPQRDKLSTGVKGYEKVPEHIVKPTPSPLVRTTQPKDEDTQMANPPEDETPEEEQKEEIEARPVETDKERPEEERNTNMDIDMSVKEFPPLPTTESTESTTQKIQSTLKKSFVGIARESKDKPPPLLPQWKAHRLACMFSIAQPENNNDRINMITTELNKMMVSVKKYTGKVFVRKFVEHCQPRDGERKHWISMLDRTKASDLIHYTHGFLAWVAPRSGTQRLLIQLILPVQTNIPDLLLDMNNSQWASKNERRLYDIKEQDLYAPRQVGWLFRSNHVMAASDELQKEFERRGKIKFGLTFKTVTIPGQKYDKDTAVKAVCVSTNEADVDAAWSLMTQWYNSDKPVYPLGIQLIFVPGYNHPHVHNNPHAAKNISTLLERQKIFINDTASVPCPILAAPDESTKATANRTIRQLLMEVTAVTMGDDLLGAKLFHAISKKTAMDGTTCYHFTFHKVVEREAKSVVSGLAQFIKKELRINPDPYCFAHMYDTSQKWNKKTRCLTNETTNFLDKIAGISLEQDDEIQEGGEIFTMDAKQKRESRRILGLKDDETVTDLTKKKKKDRESDEMSQVSEISGLTPYTSNTAASTERKNLRRQVDDKQIELEEKEAEIARLKAALMDGKTLTQGNTVSPGNLSGEDTAESPPQQEGWEPDPDYNTPPKTVDVHQGNTNTQSVVDLTKEMDDESEESARYSCKEDYYDEEDRQIPYFGADFKDGLRFIYRGSIEEIIEVRKEYTDSTLYESSPFYFKGDPDEKWVELFQVVDEEKFEQWYNTGDVKSTDTCVRFSDNVKVQEVDVTGEFGKETEVNINRDQESVNSDIDYTEESKEERSLDSDTEDPSQYSDAMDSEAQSDEEVNSTRSTDSSISHMDVDTSDVQAEDQSNARGSNITKDMLEDASRAIVNTNTDGGGPNNNE